MFLRLPFLDELKKLVRMTISFVFFFFGGGGGGAKDYLHIRLQFFIPGHSLREWPVNCCQSYRL